MTVTGMTDEQLRKFWSFVNKSESCWMWIGPTTNPPPRNYGWFYTMGKTQRVHRMMWELTRGPIPKGLFICLERRSCERSKLRAIARNERLKKKGGRE